MTKTAILLIVYISWILKNMYNDDLYWVETPLDWVVAFGINSFTPTIVCGLILYFFS